MRKREQKNQYDLTEDEIAVLKASSVPKEVKEFVVRNYDTIGARTTAYEKIAAAARAERLALSEIRRLHEAREAITVEADWRVRINELEGEKKALEADNAAIRQRMAQAIAEPAMAVYSRD